MDMTEVKLYISKSEIRCVMYRTSRNPAHHCNVVSCIMSVLHCSQTWQSNGFIEQKSFLTHILSGIGELMREPDRIDFLHLQVWRQWSSYDSRNGAITIVLHSALTFAIQASMYKYRYSSMGRMMQPQIDYSYHTTMCQQCNSTFFQIVETVCTYVLHFTGCEWSVDRYCGLFDTVL